MLLVKPRVDSHPTNAEEWRTSCAGTVLTISTIVEADADTGCDTFEQVSSLAGSLVLNVSSSTGGFRPEDQVKLLQLLQVLRLQK